MTRQTTESPDSGKGGKPTRQKRGITLYLDSRIIQRLEELGGDPETDRSISYLVNSILAEKMGLFPDGEDHE